MPLTVLSHSENCVCCAEAEYEYLVFLMHHTCREQAWECLNSRAIPLQVIKDADPREPSRSQASVQANAFSRLVCKRCF